MLRQFPQFAWRIKARLFLSVLKQINRLRQSFVRYSPHAFFRNARPFYPPILRNRAFRFEIAFVPRRSFLQFDFGVHRVRAWLAKVVTFLRISMREDQKGLKFKLHWNAVVPRFIIIVKIRWEIEFWSKTHTLTQWRQNTCEVYHWLLYGTIRTNQTGYSRVGAHFWFWYTGFFRQGIFQDLLLNRNT